MADDYQNDTTRSERFEKRRRTTKMMNYMLVLAGILVILLVILFFVGGDDEEGSEEEPDSGLEIEDTDVGDDSADSPETEENDTSSEDETEPSDDSPESTEDEEDQTEESDESNGSEESQEEDDSNLDENVDVEVEDSDEENVIEVRRGNWNPYPTEQEGQHELDLSEESQDRQELEEATAMAIGGNSSDIIYWWFGSEGDPNSIEATVENQADGEIYRVHVEWIENEGWQPQLVKVLEENDQLYRFE